MKYRGERNGGAHISMQKILVSFISLRGQLECLRWCNILKFPIPWDQSSQGDTGLNFLPEKSTGTPPNKAGPKPPGHSLAPTYPPVSLSQVDCRIVGQHCS